MRSKSSQENGQVYQNKNLDNVKLLDRGDQGRIRWDKGGLKAKVIF